jgi:DNA-binding beta-propeller fold protein YncE
MYSSAVIAGSVAGYDDAAGIAINAKFNSPRAVAVTSNGTVYVADIKNNIIRMLVPKSDSSYAIATVVGKYVIDPNNQPSGLGAYAGDGDISTNARLNAPTGLAVDASGSLYIAEFGNNVIRKVSSIDSKISTIAGNQSLGEGYAGDVGIDAKPVQFSGPVRVWVSPDGHKILVADRNNNRVRQIDVR